MCLFMTWYGKNFVSHYVKRDLVVLLKPLLRRLVQLRECRIKSQEPFEQALVDTLHHCQQANEDEVCVRNCSTLAQCHVQKAHATHPFHRERTVPRSFLTTVPSSLLAPWPSPTARPSQESSQPLQAPYRTSSSASRRSSLQSSYSGARQGLWG
jgi:hypothetical protein